MEATKPDEEIPAWKYLDIYLFSNGQENSPPRKYHLVSDNLEFWKETLKELAQEQFGSPDYIIDLYTTQGRLIKTPLELSHKKAYVAVKSPEDFIDAGYDRYLLRATRSWEKRQDKRSNNTAEKSGEDLTGKADPESIAVLKTIVPSMVDYLGSVIVKPRDRNTSISKPLDRAERTFSKGSSLSKKNDTALSPVKPIKTPIQRTMHNDETTDQSPSKSPLKVNKVFKKRRNSEAVLSKVEEVVSQLENSSPRNVEQINAKTKRNENRPRSLMTKPVENEKDHRNKPKTIPHWTGNRPRILMTKPVENEKDQQRTKLKPFSNSIENRNRTTIPLDENVKIEQNKPEMMPHLNENQLDTKVVNPNDDAKQHFNENNQTLVKNGNENEHVINVGTPSNISKNNTSNQQNYNNVLVPPILSTEKKQQPTDKSDNASKAGNYIDILNNHDGLKKKDKLSPVAASTMTNTLSNLSKGIINMRIEVWNSSDITRNASCEIKAPVIILRNEIGSQVDMAGQTGQNKVLHQVIASDKDGIDGNYKVILVRNSCPNNNVCENSKHTVIGECVMFLPVIQLDELYCRCSGGETNDIKAMDTNSCVYNPVKKSASCMSVHKENANRISIVTDNHHEEIRPDSAGLNLNDVTIQDKTEPSEKILSNNDKQFEESSKTLENSPSELVKSVRTSEVRVLARNSESTNVLYKPEVPPKDTLDSKEDEREAEYSVTYPDSRKPMDTEEPKSKQIKMHVTEPETKESVSSKISKFSESQVPVASDFEKVKKTKTDESVEIIHSKTEELNMNEPELSSAHAKSDELSKRPSADSEVSKRTGIIESKESIFQLNSEKLTTASAVAEATSLIETSLEPAKPQAPTQDKASQTEWTDVLWEAKLQEDGHYTFHLPTLTRLKEYNL